MRKGLNLIAGAVAMAVSGSSAFAVDAHPAFGGFSASAGGVIALTGITDCNNGNFTCDIVAGGDGGGFVQFMAKSTTDNKTYVGTIVTDSNASGAPKDLGFVDESYVRMEMCGTANCTGTNGGISGQQSIKEASADGTMFASNVKIATGDNFGGAGPSIQIAQSLLNTTADATTNRGDDFMSDFFYEATNNVTTGAREGFIMQIDQVAGLQSATDATGTATDVQSFTYREAAGTRQSAPGGGQLQIAGVLDASGNQVVVGYSDKDDIKAVWLGQDVGAAGSFSYLSFENKSTTTGNLTSDFDLSSAAGPTAADWGTAFNLQFSGTHPINVDDSGNPVSLGISGAPTLDNPSGRL